MTLNSAGKPVVHRGHLNLSAFQRTKTAFNDHKPLVTTSGVLKTDCVVIGFKHPFAIILGGRADLAAVDANTILLGNRQITFEAFGGQQFNRPLGFG